MSQREKPPQTLSGWPYRMRAQVCPLRPAVLLGIPTYNVYDGNNDNKSSDSYATLNRILLRLAVAMAITGRKNQLVHVNNKMHHTT